MQETDEPESEQSRRYEPQRTLQVKAGHKNHTGSDQILAWHCDLIILLDLGEHFSPISVS